MYKGGSKGGFKGGYGGGAADHSTWGSTKGGFKGSGAWTPRTWGSGSDSQARKGIEKLTRLMT